MLGIFKKKKRPINPVPEWKPTIEQPLDTIIERMKYYTEGKSDFAVFQHGTCVILQDGQTEDDAAAAAKTVLARILNQHPDFRPMHKNDGNILVAYNHPAYNVVLKNVVEEHWEEIDQNHLKALATSEVLQTPKGWNVFDDVGKKCLFGRCYLFMDALNPNVVQIVRKSFTH